MAKKVKKNLKKEVSELKAKIGEVPGLAVILVGEDPASETYVKMKGRSCKEAGIYSEIKRFDDDISEEELLKQVENLNKDDKINGILVQLPLPDHIDTERIVEAVSIKKDVDGFHPYNSGRLLIGLDSFAPCTPLGVMEMFKEYDIDVKGKNAVVVGASNIVGKPMASLLLNSFATVEICHIHTDNLKKHTLNADILIVGVGKPDLITEDMVKKDAIVIDIGINKVNGKLTGDVDYENVSKKASKITPVPGGVGPMTIAMLLKNTVKAYKDQNNI
ncbi:MAG: bifunctional methylenetetrahydrofolate dehydrogenase/methenyltetrahydrofolate cyclohydrolase FolD [Fusobacteriota bacterium]